MRPCPITTSPAARLSAALALCVLLLTALFAPPSALAQSAPAVPTLSGTVDGSKIPQLSWTASTGATSYTMERSGDGGTTWATLWTVAAVNGGTPATSGADTTASPDTSYSYRVHASDAYGDSAPSNVVALVTSLPALQITSLVWSPVNPQPGDIVSFGATVYNAGAGTAYAGTWNLEFEGTDLNNGEVAWNVGTPDLGPGQSVYLPGVGYPYGWPGPWWAAVPGEYTVLAVIDNAYVGLAETLTVPCLPPTGLTASPASGGGIDLSWTASQGATSYNLYRGTASGAETLYRSGLTGTSCQDAGLTAGVTYYYRVSGVVSGMESGLSAEASAAPGPGTGAGFVSGLDLGFEAPYQGTGLSAFTYGQTGTPWTFSGGAGISANGTYLTYSNPGAPEGVQVGFVQGTASISQPLTSSSSGTWAVTFSAAQRGNTSNGGQTLQVQIDGTVVGTVTPSGASYADYTVTSAALAAGTHTLAFVGTNPQGGDNTALIDDVRISLSALAAPTGLTATAASGSEIDLSWTASAGATGYIVQRSPDGSTGWTQIGTPTGTTYQDTGLPLSTTEFYRVVATAGATASSPSSVASATTPVGIIALSVDPGAVSAGDPTTGTIALSAPAPTGGLTVILSSDSPGVAALAAASVTVPAGATSATFSVTTATATTSATANLSATANGSTQTTQLSVLAHNVSSLALSPRCVPGGTPGTGTVWLTGPASANGDVVNLASDNAAATVPATVTIPAGMAFATFPITTTALPAGPATANITATNSTGTATAALQITLPAPTGLTVTPGSGQNTLTWNAVPGAAYYHIKRSTVSGGPYLILDGVNAQSAAGLTYMDVNALTGTTFY
jgi:fibronectin type 3 domain-containing protein